jgi:hypothetical protein
MTATNSTEPAKDGNGNAFNITFVAESVSGNRAQKTYIGEPVGETIITPAQDGTDGTGITPPAGAVGIRGWLSGIYNKLIGSIAVTGTFWQTTQPVSIATLPALGAGAAAIGSIIGRTTMATVTPVVTSNGAYAAGNEIGGLMTFAIGGAGSGTLLSLRVTSRTILTTALKAYVFTANPSTSTWTDNATPAINAADIIKLLAMVPLSAPDSGLGTHTIWSAGAIGEQFVAANLYVILVAVSAATLTSSSTSDITVQLGVSDD